MGDRGFLTGRVRIGGQPRGTGLLVSPSVLLTEVATLATAADAASGVVEFDDSAFELRPAELFAIDSGATLVAVAAQPADTPAALAAARNGRERPRQEQPRVPFLEPSCYSGRARRVLPGCLEALVAPRFRFLVHEVISTEDHQ